MKISLKKKKKSDNMVTKIFQKMENKSLLSIEKKIQNEKNCFIIIIIIKDIPFKK